MQVIENNKFKAAIDEHGAQLTPPLQQRRR